MLSVGHCITAVLKFECHGDLHGDSLDHPTPPHPTPPPSRWPQTLQVALDQSMAEAATAESAKAKAKVGSAVPGLPG